MVMPCVALSKLEQTAVGLAAQKVLPVARQPVMTHQVTEPEPIAELPNAV